MLALIALFLEITFTIGCIVYFVKKDRGPKEPKLMLLAAFGFGLLAVFLASFLNDLFIPETIRELIEPDVMIQPSILFVFISGLMIGIIEESAKALPLAYFLVGKRYFNEHTDGIVYFAVGGLCFSFIENLGYLAAYGGGIGIMRLIIGPFVHAALSSLFGYFLVKYKLTKRNALHVVLAFSGAVLLHGVFDFGLFSKNPYLMILSLMIAALINVSIFVLYMYARRNDQLLGLSAIGSNRYCRFCGTANPKQMLFCSSCGKKA